VELVLLASLGLLAYTYAGYPLLAGLLALIARRPWQREDIEPQVSLIILAYNEERDLAAKLENTLALDYPADKLEVIVASDGSTDATDDIARGFADRGVVLFRADDHPGKTGTTNRAAATATGEILVFSDATGEYSPGALRALVRNFADPEVGAVSGRVTYDYAGSASSDGFRAYQQLVVFARRSEGEWGTETSISGSISAVRRELFRPLPEHIDFDMAHPLHTAMSGHRTVYEPEAVSREEARERSESEFGARVRMAIFAYSFVPYLIARLGRCQRRVYVFQVLSHKLARWLSPLALVSLLVASAFLATSSPLVALLLAAQLALYGAAALGYALQGNALGRVFGVPLFFATINLAFLVGFARYLRGERIGTWSTAR